MPRSWLAVDVDDCSVPEPLGFATRIVEAGRHIRALLPAEFHNAACVVSASASTGLAGPALARLRLWFLLDRPIACADLHRWARGARAAGHPVDPQVCLPAQPIYTARPLFEGMTDPLPPALSATLLDGSFDRISLKRDQFEKELVAIERSTLHANLASGGGDWRSYLERTLGGKHGFFDPLKRGIGLATRFGASVDDVHRLVSDLLSERADLDRQHRYGRIWIDRAMTKFRAQDLRREAADRAAAAEIDRRFYRALDKTSKVGIHR